MHTLYSVREKFRLSGFRNFKIIVSAMQDEAKFLPCVPDK